MRVGFTMAGSPKSTTKVASTDTATGLTDAIKYLDGLVTGKKAVAVNFTFETAAIRVAFVTTPTEDGGTAVGHIYFPGDWLRLENWKAINTIKAVSRVAGTHGIMQVTPEFGGSGH